MFKTISIGLASFALVAAPAVSAQGDDTRTIGVTYNDLDLSSEDGREELNRRIDRAAKDVCGASEVQVGSRMPSREARRCYRDAKRQLEQHFAQVIEDQQNAG